MTKITLEFTEDDDTHSLVGYIHLEYRDGYMGGKLNPPLCNDKFDAIDLVFLSVPVPMSLFFMIF